MQTTSGADTAADAPERRVGGSHAATRPVFVDASGRRQRTVRRLGRFLVVPAAGYIALLLSSAFGGPTISSPYLPLPEAAGHHSSGRHPGGSGHRPGGAAAPGKGHGTAATGSQGGTAGTGTGPTAAGAEPTAAGAGSAAAGAEPTAIGGTSPTPALSPTASAPAMTTVSPTATVTHGRSTASHPVPTTPSHTGRGHT
ncbi:hypothetical protein ITX44_26130 [Streptomyces sp. KK5PA1]|uniref:Uncharacterized protein n=1 Tax=Actinacidiphila acididurans TaxID=2784346 RepID=A0ABS2U097_9ACTN|nr:hypothetical protein [Actinacidiphila acididurans]